MSNGLEETQKKLVGQWERTGDRRGDDKYPDNLEFQARGIYLGKKGPGHFTWWDAGRYEVLSADQIKISTANDAEVTYRFSMDGDALTFVDADGYRFQYRRIHG